MWSTLGDFSNLAKAAQELQEQAATSMKAPTSLTSAFGGSSFFNMDALQQPVDDSRKEKIDPNDAPERPRPTTPPHVYTATSLKPLAALTKSQKPAPQPPTLAKGKLVVPLPTKATTTTEKMSEPQSIFETPMPPPKETKVMIGNSLDKTGGAFTPFPQFSSTEKNEVGNKVEVDASKETSTGAEISLEEGETVAAEKRPDGEPSIPPEEKQEVIVTVDDDDEPFIPTEVDENTKALVNNGISNDGTESLSIQPMSIDLLSVEKPTSYNDPTTTYTDSQCHMIESLPETPVAVTGTEIYNTLQQPQQAPRKIYRDGITPIKPPTQQETKIESPVHDANHVPEHILDQFSAQLKRLEDNQQLELRTLQQQHTQELQAANAKLNAVESELRRVQGEMNRQKESYNLQLDSLRHELEGTQEMLHDRSKDERKVQDAHLKQLRGMEKEINIKEKANEELRHELQEKEKSLRGVQEELQASRDEYSTLKERVKVVAGELKERRAECRTLQSEVSLLKDSNVSLIDKITNLEAQGMDMDTSTQKTTAELSSLRGQLMDKEKELQEARDAIDMQAKKAEEALAAYKKKAQQSLSIANARTASAIHAKEEAEMEARAARSTADTAMEKAVAAEFKGKEAMAEAKAYVEEMKKEVAKFDDVKSQLDEATTQLERVRLEVITAQDSNKQLRCELQSVQGRYEAEQITKEELAKELSEASNRINELLDEIERLRREGQRLREDLSRANAEKQQKKNESIDSSSLSLGLNGSTASEVIPAARTAEAEATIAMLQQELQDANQAIRELKETLKATAEEHANSQSAENGDSSHHYHHHHHPNLQQHAQALDSNSHHASGGGMPLFYVMEKQAELTQARNEIARLAALVGDSEATKQEAIDEMEEMRRHLLDVKAQLDRQSRLNSPQEERVNLEYLKNVILSFLNAKSQLEKKTLLPVIGTVLCLTPQEQEQAMHQLEKDRHLSLDSVTSTMMNLRWS